MPTDATAPPDDSTADPATESVDESRARWGHRDESRRFPLRSSSIPPIVPALGAGLVVYTAYLLTHPYPALGGGLFLSMAEALVENGHALPARVAGYTPGGIPFAYPPLAF